MQLRRLRKAKRGQKYAQPRHRWSIAFCLKYKRQYCPYTCLFLGFDKMQPFNKLFRGVSTVSSLVIDGSIEHHSQHHCCAAGYGSSECPLPQVYTDEQKCTFRTSAGGQGDWRSPYDSHNSEAVGGAGGGTSSGEWYPTSAV